MLLIEVLMFQSGVKSDDDRALKHTRTAALADAAKDIEECANVEMMIIDDDIITMVSYVSYG